MWCLQTQAFERNNVMVPEAFFKVIVKLDNTPRGIAFVCKNTDGNKKKDYYVNTISQVERITGYSFFPNLDKDITLLIKEDANIENW